MGARKCHLFRTVHHVVLNIFESGEMALNLQEIEEPKET